MKTFTWTGLTSTERKKALARPLPSLDNDLRARVYAVLQQVQERGDAALRDYSRQFDKVELKELRIDPGVIAAAPRSINPDLLMALKQAKANIEKFHQAEKPAIVKVETMPGVTCELHWRAHEVIGIYIPGGTAPLFSAVLMQAIPAAIAGCGRKVLCTPPHKNGHVHPAILAASSLAGINEIYMVGGAQAIAAMAYGTDSIPKVDKIFGPGNAYVTMAKQLVSQDPNGAPIDMPAGPSEVLVIAEKTARASWVAADLLAQAEHDPAAQAILVTTDSGFATAVDGEVQQQLARLPRNAIAQQSISESRIIIAPDMETAIEISNLYAPEHVIIHNDNAAAYLPQIQHAGSVFLGATTPESAGDYASGANHVLPTYGYARAYSGLSVYSFMKSMSVQSLSPQGLVNLAPTIIAMAENEGLDGHANAVKIRLGAQ